MVRILPRWYHPTDIGQLAGADVGQNIFGDQIDVNLPLSACALRVVAVGHTDGLDPIRCCPAGTGGGRVVLPSFTDAI